MYYTILYIRCQVLSYIYFHFAVKTEVMIQPVSIRQPNRQPNCQQTYTLCIYLTTGCIQTLIYVICIKCVPLRHKPCMITYALVYIIGNLGVWV